MDKWWGESTCSTGKSPRPLVSDMAFFTQWLVNRTSPICVFVSSFSLQPLVFTTFSLAKAEEMADLIDGYCMLFSGNKHSLVFKKLGMAKPLFCAVFVIEGREKIEIQLPSEPVNFSLHLPWTTGFQFQFPNHLATWLKVCFKLAFSLRLTNGLLAETNFIFTGGHQTSNLLNPRAKSNPNLIPSLP